eukprot:CAMPEP_0205927452 /NCGR_PEP_ID=MMETSP1325-20131115/22631_1 /ASSEMBLY_ACC=CAM_ASM_000708 /TAXON_ID=236786 /ORGANISM="Florenciella sp., Strain RCC1007" /LENGTH=54 /DNA_ID=CAMNT_0053296329 /DNA_START=45 /DNA_END=206 /DNA_ORIENTATION=+
MTQEKYIAAAKNNTGSTINHFPEKLLKLAAMMKTRTGRRMAQSRHDYMLDFLAR